MFEQAGYMIPAAQRQELAQMAVEEDRKAVMEEKGNFDTLYTCNEVGH